VILGGYLPASAQDRPTNGLLFNTVENASLQFSCKPAGPDAINCEFHQISVRKNAKPEDLERALQRADEEFATLKREASCEEYQFLIDVLDGKTQAQGRRLTYSAKSHTASAKSHTAYRNSQGSLLGENPANGTAINPRPSIALDKASFRGGRRATCSAVRC
jgi:hypothetical protein